MTCGDGVVSVMMNETLGADVERGHLCERGVTPVLFLSPHHLNKRGDGETGGFVFVELIIGNKFLHAP